MSLFVLDMGSGNTCKNDRKIIDRMIHEVADVDTGRHDIILKWQLFKSAPPNVPLEWDAFRYAYEVADRLCFRTTSSVFDLESLRFLMGFDVPFVKIANRPDLYQLAEYSTVPVYISTSQSGYNIKDAVMMACISEYPATLEMYENAFTKDELRFVSDHTEGWDLYTKHDPIVIEKHFVHVRDLGNPDAGPFSVTPTQLAEVL